MCDTIVVTGEATLDGVTIFAKNSDREPNEAHHLVAFPAQDWSLGSRVRLTYIEIPQVDHTYAVLLAKPFNIWGAEIGANQHGVVIGNESLFTRVPYEKGPGMTGMDLLRLGVERSRTASEAVQVMTGLLETHGQGGNSGFQQPFYYHNSFLIADPHDAWVLEAAGRQWAAKQVRGVYAISNGISLHNEWDLASASLVSYAVERGWCKGRDDLDFARLYSDPFYTRFSNCRYRCRRASGLLEAQRGRITPRLVMDMLRDHGWRDREWRPDRGLTSYEVCGHAGFGPVHAHNQTTGSMVSYLDGVHAPTHFFTASAAPCTGLFKPVWLDAGLPPQGPTPSGVYDPQTIFWSHERLHRLTLQDYPNRIAVYCGERDALEDRLARRAIELAAAPVDERYSFSQASFFEGEQAEAAWLDKVCATPVKRSVGRLYKTAWKGFNRQAGITEALEDHSSVILNRL